MPRCRTRRVRLLWTSGRPTQLRQAGIGLQQVGVTQVQTNLAGPSGFGSVEKRAKHGTKMCNLASKQNRRAQIPACTGEVPQVGHTGLPGHVFKWRSVLAPPYGIAANEKPSKASRVMMMVIITEMFIMVSGHMAARRRSRFLRFRRKSWQVSWAFFRMNYTISRMCLCVC